MSGHPAGGRHAYDDGYSHPPNQQDQYYQDDDRYYDSNGYDHGHPTGDGYYDESYVQVQLASSPECPS